MTTILKYTAISALIVFLIAASVIAASIAWDYVLTGLLQTIQFIVTVL